MAAVFAAAIGVTGCGYQVAGMAGALPKSIHTIAIPQVKNSTIQYKLSDLLTTCLGREFISRSHYKIIPGEKEADAILTVVVNNVVTYPTIYDPIAGRATGTQIIVILNFTLRDKAGAVILTRANFEVRDRYEISIDPKQYFDESEPAMQRLATNIARTVVSAILNRF